MLKIYQIAIGEIPETIQTLMNSVSSFAAQNGYEYECLKLSHGAVDPFFLSDTMRIQIMCDDPDAIYCDWDYSFLKPFVFDRDDKPYFAFNSHNVPHFSLMYCNNQQKFFESVFEEKAKRKIDDCVSWPMKIIRDKAHLVHKIESDCYQHAQHSTNKKLVEAQQAAIDLKKYQEETCLFEAVAFTAKPEFKMVAEEL